jgi:hypothetical protein
MLRINVHDEGESTSFTIEGRLGANVVSELEGCWQAALKRAPLKPIVVRLNAVSLVARMRRDGVRLIPNGTRMSTIVEQIEAEIEEVAEGPLVQSRA